MNFSYAYMGFLSLPGGTEWIVIAIFGLLIFGKRLPEVGKSLGRSIVEFKKGLKGIEGDIDKAVDDNQAEMLPPPAQHNNTTSAGGQASSSANSTGETT